MSVATGLRKSSARRVKPSKTVRLKVEMALDRATHRAIPVDFWVHHVALVETAWGTAGVRWRVLSRADQAFIHDSPQQALLTRIILPGAGDRELRRLLTEKYPAATEIFASSRGRFHPETVPHWFAELRELIVNTYVANWQHQPFQAELPHDQIWRTWRPRLDHDVLTPFQARVLEAVAAIPRGQVRTYAQIAEQLNAPRAARAVGGALQSNPWPALIPCHRVVGASGAMTGFTAPGGVRAKRQMLVLERALQQNERTLWPV
jgi:O-6-methylguanine DNA methyltransferase